jgi:hypothetical protein
MMKNLLNSPVRRLCGLAGSMLVSGLLLSERASAQGVIPDSPRPSRFAFPSDAGDFGFSSVSGLGNPIAVASYRNVAGELFIARGHENGTLDLARFAASSIGSVPPFTICVATAGGPVLDVGSNAVPTLADLDNDGSPELVIGNSAGELVIRQLSFQATEVIAAEITGPLGFVVDGIDVGEEASPAFGDLDGDGDLDLLVMNNLGVLHQSMNGGTPNVPTQFTIQASSPPAGLLLPAIQKVRLALGDLDGDGRADGIVGLEDGTAFVLNNTFGSTSAGSIPLTVRGESFRVASSNASPSLVDFDGDGALDLIVGDATGGLVPLVGIAPELAIPGFTISYRDSFLSTSVASSGGAEGMALWDTDQDGDLDAFFTLGNGDLGFAQSGPVAGSASDFTIYLQAVSPFTIQHRSIAVGGILDSGGEAVLAGTAAGELRVLPFTIQYNSGIATDYTITNFSGATPFDGQFYGANACPALVDLDDDGDLDLFVGSFTVDARNGFPMYRNEGSDSSLVSGGLTPFTVQLTSATPIGSGTILRSASFVDLDSDGDFDGLVHIEGETSARYLENVGTSTVPEFFLHDLAPIPLTNTGGVVVASGDINGDGLPEMIALDSIGDIQAIDFTGNSFILPAGDSRTTIPLGDDASVTLDVDGGTSSTVVLAHRRLLSPPELLVALGSFSLPPSSNAIPQVFELGGILPPGTSSASLRFTPAPSNTNGLLPQINRVFQVSGSGPTITPHPNVGLGTVLALDASSVTVSGVTGFSEWFLVVESSSVFDWKNY